MKNEQILQILPMHLRSVVQGMELEDSDMQEIRIRSGQFPLLQYDRREILVDHERRFRIREEHIREMMEYISQYSLYAYEQELKQGYITIEGGHRVGIAGKTMIEHGRVKSIQHISSINIRIAHQVLGCAREILPYLVQEGGVCHTLIISPPRCGKTTILRDLIRQCSNGNRWIEGQTMGVVDERSELGACYQGVPQNDLGKRTDILDACPKVEGMMMLVRSMSPQVIAVDEVGMPEEVQAMEYASRCGCKLLASVHGTSLEDIRQKPVLRELLEKKLFQRYIVLSNAPKVGSVKEVYDGDGLALYEAGR